jgi:hypothetical protein
MTKLYHGPEGFGWQVPGQQERKATRVDVPNAPAELAEWLNVRWVQREPQEPTLADVLDLERAKQREEGELAGDEQLEPQLSSARRGPMVPGKCDACGRSPEGALKLQRGAELDTIGDWLEEIGLTELWVLERLADRVRDRARELGAEWAGRSVQ